MDIDTLEYFPTLFYEVNWTEDEILPLLKEVQEKKEKIKIKGNSETDDYQTDYSVQEKLLEYEKLIEKVTFSPKLQYSHIVYWTAIYGEKGYHASHNHNGSLFGQIDPNMSSILYLSNIGGTRFWNPSEMAVTSFIPSKVGKMIMWPSYILHTAPPHEKKNEERFIISSNWKVKEIYPGSFYNE